MLPHPLVLASTSTYRKTMLEKLNLPFITASPNTDETAFLNEKPEDLVLRLASEKAQSIKSTYSNHLIIASDQVATLEDGTILTKPHTHENAIKQLHSCSGRSVLFLTGLSLLNSSNNKQQTIVEPFQVTFRALSLSEIDHYLKIEQPYDCAGSFKVEGMGICLFEKLSGDDFNSLIGLPLIRLLTLLRNEGVNPLKQTSTTY